MYIVSIQLYLFATCVCYALFLAYIIEICHENPYSLDLLHGGSLVSKSDLRVQLLYHILINCTGLLHIHNKLSINNILNIKILLLILCLVTLTK